MRPEFHERVFRALLWLYPAPFLRMINGSVQALVDRLNHGTVAAAHVAVPVSEKVN